MNHAPAPSRCDAAEGLAVVTVTMMLDEPLPESVSEVGWTAQVASSGAPEHDRFTVAVELFCGVSDSLNVALCPALMVFVSDAVVMVNAGAGALTVWVKVVDVLPANCESPLYVAVNV